MTWIKICGTTNLDDALASVEAGADALGFVFAPSPRRISPRDAAKMIAGLPAAVEKIGVFVNQSAELLLDTVRTAGLTGVQLHGEEDGKFARQLREKCAEIRIIKTVSMREAGEGSGKALALATQPQSGFDALLLDSGGNGKRGGTGIVFDWQQAAPLARLLARKFRLIIAGGLAPENAGKALRLFQPWGLDVVSGVEQAPGKKDRAKLQAFVAAVRALESAEDPQKAETSK